MNHPPCSNTPYTNENDFCTTFFDFSLFFLTTNVCLCQKLHIFVRRNM